MQGAKPVTFSKGHYIQQHKFVTLAFVAVDHFIGSLMEASIFNACKCSTHFRQAQTGRLPCLVDASSLFLELLIRSSKQLRSY